MTQIRVSEDLRDDLNLLKEIHGKRYKNLTGLIRDLLDCRQYNEEFFERIREKVIE